MQEMCERDIWYSYAYERTRSRTHGDRQSEGSRIGDSKVSGSERNICMNLETIELLRKQITGLELQVEALMKLHGKRSIVLDSGFFPVVRLIDLCKECGK